jgi:hypothetical protein
MMLTAWSKLNGNDRLFINLANASKLEAAIIV